MPNSTRTTGRYNNVAIVLHWAMAIVIIGMLAGGKFMTSLDEADPLRFSLTQWHKSFGLTILFLTLIRILWRLTHRAPALPDTMRGWERFAAHSSHWLFYVLMFLMPISGWLLVSASPLNITTFLFDLVRVPHLPWASTAPNREALAHQFHNVHYYISIVLILLLVLHIGAALRHQLILRDNIFARMQPDMADGSFADGMRLSAGFMFALVGSVLLFQSAKDRDFDSTGANTNTETPITSSAIDDSASWPAAKVSYSVIVMNGELTGEFPNAKAYTNIDRSNLSASVLNAVVNTATSDAGNPQIDDALPNPGWFDSVRFPEASFTSRKITAQSDNAYLVEGDLTIRDVTQTVTFTLTTDDQGRADGEFTINRLDYDVGSNEQPDGKVAAIDVTVKFNIQLESN